MARKQTPLTNTRAVTTDTGVLTQEARIYFSELESRLPIYGDGSPEGIISAQQGATYYDLSASTGSMIYIKKQASISGDDKQGWALA